MNDTEIVEGKNYFSSFANFIQLTFRRCAELIVVKLFLPESQNSDRVRAAAATLSGLKHDAVRGDPTAMGELVLLATLAVNYTTQASRAQPALAAYHAQLTPAWPVMMFRQEGLNRLNEELLKKIHVGSGLHISNKAMIGLEDGSAGVAAMLKIYLEIRRAIKRRERETGTAQTSAQTSQKTDHYEAKSAYDESFRYEQNPEQVLRYFGKPDRMKEPAYLKLVWRWLRRNRVKDRFFEDI